MYLHIGNGQSIKKESIIGIFDLDTATVSTVTKRFINKFQKNNKIKYGDTDLPRAFILYEDGKEEKISLSRISSFGLKMRAEERGYEGLLEKEGL